MARFIENNENNSSPPDIRLVNEQELSKLLGWSRAKLQRDRYCGAGIPYIKSTGKRGAVRYSLKDVYEYIESRKRTSTSDPGQEQ